MFPDRRKASSSSPRTLKPSCHNYCSNSCIRSDACWLTNPATKHSSSIRSNGVNGVAVFDGSPIRYNIPQFIAKYETKLFI